MKKYIPEKQMEGRISAAICYLNQRGCYNCPISARLSDIIATRISKGNIQRKSAQILKHQITIHLTSGELDVESEIRAAINDWLVIYNSNTKKEVNNDCHV